MTTRSGSLVIIVIARDDARTLDADDSDGRTSPRRRGHYLLVTRPVRPSKAFERHRRTPITPRMPAVVDLYGRWAVMTVCSWRNAKSSREPLFHYNATVEGVTLDRATRRQQRGTSALYQVGLCVSNVTVCIVGV